MTKLDTSREQTVQVAMLAPRSLTNVFLTRDLDGPDKKLEAGVVRRVLQAAAEPREYSLFGNVWGWVDAARPWTLVL
ncbi:hypothetical protein VTK26DRAFT_8047 [Humicola hyalothermophila]